MLFLLIVLPVAIGFACLKLLDSKQWLQAMIASALLFCIAAGWWFKQPFFGLFIAVWVFAAFFLPWIIMLWLDDQPFPKIDLHEMWNHPFMLLDRKTDVINELWGGAGEEDAVEPPSAKERKLRSYKR